MNCPACRISTSTLLILQVTGCFCASRIRAPTSQYWHIFQPFLTLAGDTVIVIQSRERMHLVFAHLHHFVIHAAREGPTCSLAIYPHFFHRVRALQSVVSFFDGFLRHMVNALVYKHGVLTFEIGQFLTGVYIVYLKHLAAPFLYFCFWIGTVYQKIWEKISRTFLFFLVAYLALSCYIIFVESSKSKQKGWNDVLREVYYPSSDLRQ